MSVEPPEIITRVIGPLGNNCFALIDPQTRQTAIIDPGLSSGIIMRSLPLDAKVVLILLTHGHFDHVAGVGLVKQATGARIGIHHADLDLMRSAKEQAFLFDIEMNRPPEPDFFFDSSEAIQLGNSKIRVMHTPGHSPGGVTLVAGDAAFVGDALFAGSIGRTDLQGSDYLELMTSITEKILSLPDDTKVLPGHGPASTVGHERRTNPFILDFLSRSA